MMKKSGVAAGIFMATATFGQPRLSLQDAVQLALKKNYAIEIARNDVAINTINNHIGVAGGLPTVTGSLADNAQVSSINQKFNNAAQDAQRNGAFSNNLSANITGSILLFNGYRVSATKRRLVELQQQSIYLLNAQIQSTVADVMFKYYDVVRQQGFSKTIERSIEAAGAKLSIVQTRRSVGMANLADENQALLDLNTLLQLQQSQQLLIDQGKTDLLTLLSAKADSAITIQDTIILDTGILLDTIQNRINNYPALLAAQEQIKINEQVAKETAALRTPTVRANTGFNFSNVNSSGGNNLLNQNYGPFLGFGLTVPIYNGGIVKRQQQVAAINIKNAKTQLENLYLNTNAGVVKNFQAYQNALQQLKTQRDNYKLSQQLLDLVLQRFQLGQATVIDVNLAQQSFANAGYTLVNLTYQAKVGEIGLKQITNQLGF